jgi:hypothetical protein
MIGEKRFFGIEKLFRYSGAPSALQQGGCLQQPEVILLFWMAEQNAYLSGSLLREEHQATQCHFVWGSTSLYEDFSIFFTADSMRMGCIILEVVTVVLHCCPKLLRVS